VDEGRQRRVHADGGRDHRAHVEAGIDYEGQEPGLVDDAECEAREGQRHHGDHHVVQVVRPQERPEQEVLWMSGSCCDEMAPIEQDGEP
jgi:hypothetical protein